MTLLRFIYKNFDPDHLIPERGWLAVIALGVQTGLLFVVALLLVKLDSTSTNKTAVFHQKFTETAVLSNEFDNLYNHIKLYEQSVGNYINTGDSLALAVTRNEQLLVEESLAILGRLVDESGKPVLAELQQAIGNLFSGSIMAQNLLQQEGRKPALTKLAETIEADNSSTLCHTLFGIQMEAVYSQVDSSTKASGAPYRMVLYLMCLLAGFVFLLAVYIMLRTTRRVMADRRAFLRVSEEEHSTREFTQNMLDILPIGFHSADKDGLILDMNQTELDWLGYTKEEVAGKIHVTELYDSTFLEHYQDLFKKFTQEGHLKNVELTLLGKDGQPIPILITAKAIYDQSGNFTHSITTVYNFTERKKLEKELIAAHEIAERAQQLKQLFMANMSHEIRTPLNAIIGFSNLLNRSDIQPELKEYIQGIQISGANLLGIVNDILDFEKIRSGMLRIEHIEFDLAGLLHSVVTMVRSSAEEKHLALQLVMQKDLPEVLLGDPMRLTQILINLLSNAIKFTSSGSVTLRIQVIPNPTPDATIRIRFEVEDTGIGIAASEHERIFERFIQASSETSRKFGGTGLGLALVKMLVEMQKGSINLVSKPGEGSTFSIEIPYYSMRKEMRSENEMVEAERYPDLNGRHILLVEDNAMNRRIAELYLLKLGLTITQAVDGIEALDLLREKPGAFDLVLMDIQMPRLDGYATAKAIRQELKLSTLPIIAMTAHVLSGEREKVLSFGMNDYLSKPVNQRDLAAMLVKYFSCQPENGIPNETKPAAIKKWRLLLADDDPDDFLLFKQAIEELAIPAQLINVQNGEQLVQMLKQHSEPLPDVLFLDLNMPRKNGFQCLLEIKEDERLKHIPVIIYSTSMEKAVINMLYKTGAHYFIQKPNSFSLLKQVIYKAISNLAKNHTIQPLKEQFVLSPKPDAKENAYN